MKFFKQRSRSQHQQSGLTLEEVGALLRQARLSKSLSLAEVSEQTKVQRRLLEAIELGQAHQLPEPVYVLGFIKRFAAAVGLEDAELNPIFPTNKYATTPTVQSSWRTLPAAQLRPIHLYLIYIALIVGAVNGLSGMMSRSAPTVVTNVDFYQPPTRQNPPGQPGAANQSTPTNPNTLAAGSSFSAAERLAPIFPFLNSLHRSTQPVQVSVILKAQSWLRVVVDGKMEFEGVLPEGTQRTWAAKEQVTLRAGNAGSVLVAVNNGEAKQLGDPGAVQEVTFGKTQAANAGMTLLAARGE